MSSRSKPQKNDSMPDPNRREAAGNAGEERNCISRPDAETIVFACAGKLINVDTKLEDAFPNHTIRRNFCGCVVREAKKKSVEVDVPCAPDTTIEAVIVSLTC